MEFTFGKSEKGAERGQKTRREIKKCMAKSLRMKFPRLSSTYVEFTLGKVPQQFRCLNHILGSTKEMPRASASLSEYAKENMS